MRMQLFQSVFALLLPFLTLPAASFAAAPDVNGCTPSTITYFSDAANSNLSIGSGGTGSVTSTINVSAFPDNGATIYDVDVITNVTHTYIGDLVLSVQRPGSGSVKLVSLLRSNVDNAYAGTVWDDQADDPVLEHVFSDNVVATKLSPEQSLTRLNGTSPNGAWTLTVNDEFEGDSGTLVNWGLRITYCAPAHSVVEVESKIATVPIPDNGTEAVSTVFFPASAVNGTACFIEMTSTITHPRYDELQIELQSPKGTKASVSKKNRIQNASTVSATWNDSSLPAKTAYTTGGGLEQTALAPDEPFALFYGENPAGTWSLRVKDTTPGQTGNIGFFRLAVMNCGFAPEFNDQSLPAVEELTPNGMFVGTPVAKEIFNIGKKDNSGPGFLQDANGDGLIFTNTEPIRIRSLTVFPEHSGIVGITLYRFINAQAADSLFGTGRYLQFGGEGVRLAVPFVPFVVNPPSQGVYLLSLDLGTNIGQTKKNTGVTFPFTRPGTMEITIDAGIGTGNYSGLYNWEVDSTPKTIKFSIISGDPDEAFAIDPTTGTISVKNTDNIRFATKPSYALAVRAETAEGVVKVATVTIPVTARAKPKISCPSDVTVGSGASTAAEATGSATAKDVKDGAVTAFNVDVVTGASCPLKQKIFREWKAFDSDGNSDSCTQTITVSETVSDDRNGNGVFECDGELGTTDVKGQCVPGAGDCIYEKLKSSACVGANGFLGQINIASVINLQLANLGVTVQYIDAGGTVRGQVGTTIAPNLKADFIINDLGLQPDTIGTVCVATSAGGAGAWTGGISIYKPDVRNGVPPFGTKFDFALYYPFLNPATGATTTPLNTFHLGTSPAAVVANWISIIDAVRGDGQGVAGAISVFDASGKVLKTLQVNLPDGGRADFPGHEALSGFQNADAVGLAQFVPSNSASYYMTLTRYFYDCPGASCTNFLTAFNIPKRPGSAQSVSGLVSTFDGELAIVELNNVTTTDGSAALEVFGSSGASAGQSTISVPARATNHIIVNNSGQSGFLASNEIGSAKVQATSGSLSALSIFYKLSSTGTLQYAYAAPLVESPGVSQLSQFNTFIAHSNRIELVNTNSAAVTAQVSFFDYTGKNILNSGLITLAPKQTKRLDTSSLPKDSYGTFTVSAGTGVIVRNYVSRSGEYTVPFLGE